MVDRDNAQLWLTLNIDRYSWLIESGSDSVDWDRVVGVGGIGRNIADDAELAILGSQALHVDKVWNLRGKINAVDKDVTLHDLWEWSSLGSLSHIPLKNVLGWYTSAKTKVYSTATASSQSTDDKDTWGLASLRRSLSNSLLDIGDQKVLILVVGNAWKWLGVLVGELP